MVCHTRIARNWRRWRGGRKATADPSTRSPAKSGEFAQDLEPSCPDYNPANQQYQVRQFKPVLWQNRTIQELATVGGDQWARRWWSTTWDKPQGRRGRARLSIFSSS